MINVTRKIPEKKIFETIKDAIFSAEVEEINTSYKQGEGYKTIKNLHIVTKNGSKDGFCFYSSRDFAPLPSRTIRGIEIDEIISLESDKPYLYDLLIFVSDKEQILEVQNMLHHLKAFSDGILIKLRAIRELEEEISLIKKHIERYIYFWGFVNEINIDGNTYRDKKNYGITIKRIKKDEEVLKKQMIFYPAHRDIPFEALENEYLTTFNNYQTLRGAQLYDIEKYFESLCGENKYRITYKQTYGFVKDVMTNNKI